MKLKDLKPAEHHIIPGLIVWRVIFPNGYGVSIIKGESSLSIDKDLYEVAETTHNYKLIKPIALDVQPRWKICELWREIRGDYTEEQVNQILKEVENYVRRDNEGTTD